MYNIIIRVITVQYNADSNFNVATNEIEIKLIQILPLNYLLILFHSIILFSSETNNFTSF